MRRPSLREAGRGTFSQVGASKDMTLTERGRIEGGAIVFENPLRLPEGTEVVVRIETVEGTAPRAPAAVRGGSPSREELERFAREHPAPQEWWESDDNPFEPQG
jgi:hypothetical protein